jgi:hypothetical protein
MIGNAAPAPRMVPMTAKACLYPEMLVRSF